MSVCSENHEVNLWVPTYSPEESKGRLNYNRPRSFTNHSSQKFNEHHYHFGLDHQTMNFWILENTPCDSRKMSFRSDFATFFGFSKFKFVFQEIKCKNIECKWLFVEIRYQIHPKYREKELNKITRFTFDYEELFLPLKLWHLTLKLNYNRKERCV